MRFSLHSFAVLLLVGLFAVLFMSGCQSSVSEQQRTIHQGKVVLAEPFLSLNPLSAIAADRQVLAPVYEGLVGFDERLKPVPKLAYTYGKLGDAVWQLKLRPEVNFHDGTKLTKEHVLATFAFLKTKSPEHLKEFLANIDKIETVGDYKLIFKLKTDNPNFLRELALIPILPNTNLIELAQKPNGTGPYKLVKFKRQTVCNYERFDNYWDDERPTVRNLTYIIESDSTKRLAHQQDRDTLLILQTEADSDKFVAKQQPDLTVNFFIWNPAGSAWDIRENRRNLSKVFPYDQIETLTAGLGTPAQQFVSSGILGFNPELRPVQNDILTRARLAKESKLVGQNLKFAVPPDLEQFAYALVREFKGVGIDAEAYLVRPEQLFDREETQGIHLLFVGWRSDLGTADSFLQSFFVKDSKYNLANYENPKLDQLLAKLTAANNDVKRQAIIQEIMTITAIDDPFGLPLFYGRLRYSARADFSAYYIRPDGIIGW